jgi:cold shock CspA family protein
MQGIITTYFAAKGWGFLRPDSVRGGRGSGDLFFHRSAIAGGVAEEGWVVEFIEERDSKSGRPRAVNLRRLTGI